MTTQDATDNPASAADGAGSEWLRRFLWQRPRAHGEVWADREVSFLELFYDLVYVVVIARAAHHLATHVSWQGVFDFTVVFGLIWLAWLNGTLHHELHAREDVRSRLSIFAQMLLLAWLGVYTGEATGGGGRMFAVVYAILLGLFTLLWFTVRRHDDDRYRPTATRYVIMSTLATVAMFGSAFLEPEPRTWVWLAIIVSILAASAMITTQSETMSSSVTHSLVERFGLFSIIVLGEVIVGVVEGLSEVDEGDPGGRTVAIGLLALTIGFGFWWTYFDFTGRRMPRRSQPGLGLWMLAHLPATTAIAAAGAGMVDLVARGADSETPTATAWLIGGATAVMFVSVVAIMMRLEDYERLRPVYAPVAVAMLGAAVGALMVAAWRPGPLVFILTLTALLTVTWIAAIALLTRGLNRGDISFRA
ncbi:MAG: low temperature requirement protein A [Acidimicrobiia bacterium]|nr:low temperature requirement protein A [Acidimicrobiia bacterium]